MRGKNVIVLGFFSALRYFIFLFSQFIISHVKYKKVILNICLLNA